MFFELISNDGCTIFISAFQNISTKLNFLNLGNLYLCKVNCKQKGWLLQLGKNRLSMTSQCVHLKMSEYCEVREWHGHIYTTKCKMDGQWEAAAQHKEISSVLCDHLEGWDREDGREIQEGGDMGIYVYVQLIHFVIKQKLTHHCKAIILQ